MDSEIAAPLAVIFDCDGVLVDSEVLALEVELGLLAELGLAYDPAEFAGRYTGMPDSAFFRAPSADCLERIGRPLPDHYPRLHRERLEEAMATRLTEVTGARAAVSRCRRMKAVASSSTTERLRFKLERVGLWQLFTPHVYSADAVAHGKPAPDLFLYAAAALGVAAQRCLVIEDSVNGVRAGRAAGMTVWGFVGGGHCAPNSGAALLAPAPNG